MADDESKGKRVAKLLMKYCFSHLGLFLLVGGYCVGGAYLFQYLEMKGVDDNIAKSANRSFQIENERKVLAEDLWKYKWSNSYSDTVDKLLAQYQSNISDAISKYMYTGQPKAVAEFKNGWAFPSALLFTITIVTTIGYGHIVPKTDMGYLTVIFYALIGVPLMLMFLANIGEAMARFFRLAYGRGCCYFCWKKRKANYELNRQRIRDIREGRVSRKAWQDDAVLDEQGKPVFASTENAAAKRANSAGETNASRRRGQRTRSNSPNDGKRSDSKGRDADELHKAESGEMAKTEGDHKITEIDAYDIYDIIEDPDDDVINVPISLTLVIIAAYLFIGAVLFAAWNGWTWITGAYFSFVTLATIGFGDLVPGWDEVGTTTGNVKMAISCFYIVFGLAVVSMSFNLMMEEMIAKFQWLGRKLGIIDDPNAKKNIPDDKRPLVENEEKAKEEFRNADEKNFNNRPRSTMSNAPNKFDSDLNEEAGNAAAHANNAHSTVSNV